MKFRDKLIRFMYGRNGFDKLCSVLLWIGLILALINCFVNSIILYLIQTAILAYCVFRVLSKNIVKRRNENEKFIVFWNRVKGFFKLQRNKFRDRKTHIYRKCPDCKANLRLPKVKGKHTVRCPVCQKRFDVKC